MSFRFMRWRNGLYYRVEFLDYLMGVWHNLATQSRYFFSPAYWWPDMTNWMQTACNYFARSIQRLSVFYDFRLR